MGLFGQLFRNTAKIARKSYKQDVKETKAMRKEVMASHKLQERMREKENMEKVRQHERSVQLGARIAGEKARREARGYVSVKYDRPRYV